MLLLCSEPLEMPTGSSLGASVAAQRDAHSDSATSEAPAAPDQVLTWMILIALSPGCCVFHLSVLPRFCMKREVILARTKGTQLLLQRTLYCAAACEGNVNT